MKKSNFFKFTRFAWVVLLAVAVIATSCKKNEEEDPTTPEIVLDGTYIKGAGTALTTFNAKGMMKITRNEVLQVDRANLLELYVAVKGGADGFNIVTVAGNVQKTWGPGADFAEVTELNGDEPTLGLWRGSLVETATKFTVPSDGLYHIAFDSEINVVTIAKVEWGIIGAASPGGWGGSTAMPATGFDLNTMTFTVSDVVLTRGDFKFRYSNGWKVILSPDFDLGGGNVGIKVNSNFGGAVNALVPGGANITNDEPGKYTITMVWTLGAGYTATLTKTGDLETFDYSAVELGLVGDGLMVDGAQHNWDVTILSSLPVIEAETNYTWTFNGVEVTTLGSFKIRQGQDWTGKIIGYTDVTMAGLAAGDFTTNGDGNFVPTVDGTYDFELFIDAVTETYTVTVKAAGTADPELFMLGNGCAAGWDNTAALPLEGTGGLYTITADLVVGDIKFITTLGQWAPMYGSDGAGTPYAGTLVYRATESDPDPANIPVEVAGKYDITINTNDLTYTVVASGPKLWVPGAYQGWAPSEAPTIVDSDEDGVFTGLVTITGADLNFKFTSQADWAGTNYGAGATDGTLSTDGGAGNLSVPAEGTYLLTADLNNLTWSYVLQ